jgi:hypothetical protein
MTEHRIGTQEEWQASRDRSSLRNRLIAGLVCVLPFF